MDNLDRKIPEEMVPEVFAVASRLYAQKNQDYSLEEITQAAAEVQIPPELIKKAIVEIHLKRIRDRERKRKLTIIFSSLGAIVAIWSILTYNNLSRSAQTVNAAWAQVENQLQRKADLIPNLVKVTQASAKQEREIVELLTRSRQSYLEANTPGEKVVAIAQVSQAINRFQTYAATRPELTSSLAYTNLQYELVGTENRIAVERMRYNQAVLSYNQKINQFPNSALAVILGFPPKPFFKSQANTVEINP